VAALRDHHATIFVPPDCAAAIERLRRERDPVMAAQVTAHLTLAYPTEAPATDLMRGRLAVLGESTAEGVASRGHHHGVRRRPVGRHRALRVARAMTGGRAISC